MRLPYFSSAFTIFLRLEAEGVSYVITQKCLLDLISLPFCEIWAECIPRRHGRNQFTKLSVYDFHEASHLPTVSLFPIEPFQNTGGQFLSCRFVQLTILYAQHLFLLNKGNHHSVHCLCPEKLNHIKYKICIPLSIVHESHIWVKLVSYMPIFVHAKVDCIKLFGDTNIVKINEICNISQRFQPWLFSFLATCET